MAKEASSFVVATKSLLLSRVADAKENCSIMTLDVLNTFAQQDTPESINKEQIMLKISIFCCMWQ